MQGLRPRPTRQKPPKPLSPAVRQRLHREARQWKLTDDEYTRLVLALSEALRRGIPAKTVIDAKQVLGLVDNPMFGLFVEYVVKMAGRTSVDNAGADASSNSAETQTPNTPPQTSIAGPNQPQAAGRPLPAMPAPVGPPPGWEFW